jgi:hypothetical protein
MAGLAGTTLDVVVILGACDPAVVLGEGVHAGGVVFDHVGAHLVG